MVAYSFQKRFVTDIQTGRKPHTIRAHRKRHARPGEMLQLYCGMRTKGCFKIIPDVVCPLVQDISIWVQSELPSGIAGIEVAGFELDEDQVDGLARSDGFSDILQFGHFWADVHGTGRFDGALIHWLQPGEVMDL